MKKDAEIIGVWGGRGSGKSTRTREIVCDNDRLIVLDPMGDYGRVRGIKAVRDLRGLYVQIRKNWNTGFRLALVLGREDDAKKILEQLAAALFTIQKPYFEGSDRRKLTLVVEEMSISYPERMLGAGERNFMQLVNLGRHYGVEIIGVSQRIAEVKKNFVGNCSQHYFFRTGAAVDMQSVTRLIGTAYKPALTALDTHHYLYFSQGQVRKGKNSSKF